MRLMRFPACAVARARPGQSLDLAPVLAPVLRPVLKMAAVSLFCLAFFGLTGCAITNLPVDWPLWPAKEDAPRDLPVPSEPVEPPAIQLPPLQRTLPPLVLDQALSQGLPGIVLPDAPKKITSHTINIAILVPLTGPSASIGSALLDAAQLALFDVADDRIKLLPKDTGGTPEGAARAAEEALADGAELILGPLFSQSVAAVTPAARKYGVNIIAFSTDQKVAGPGVFLFGFLPEEQVERVVDHAIGQGLTRFAALIPETPYGAAILDALTAATWRRGAEVVQVETYPDTGDNPHDAVQRLADYENRHGALLKERKRIESLGGEEAKLLLGQLEGLETLGELDYDAVIIPEGGDRLRSVALLLPYYDIDPAKIRFLGTGLWDDETIGREPALIGGWFAAVPPDLSRAFADRFSTVYGTRPPRIASIAYDSLALAALLAGETSAFAGPRFSADRIAATAGFNGANGLFRLRPEGLTERGLAVVEVARHGVKVVGLPPLSFDTQDYFQVYDKGAEADELDLDPDSPGTDGAWRPPYGQQLN